MILKNVILNHPSIDVLKSIPRRLDDNNIFALICFSFQVINALKTERDVSVRQRAVDLLYAM